MKERVKHVTVWMNDGHLIAPDIKLRHPEITHVIFDLVQEIKFMNVSGNRDYVEQSIDACNEFNVPYTLISAFSTVHNKTVIDFHDPRYRNMKYIEWPTYWIARTVLFMGEGNSLNSKNDLNLFNNSVCFNVDEYKYSYIFLNNISKDHRRLMIDMLAKHDVIHDGAISYRDILRHHDSTRPANDQVPDSVKEGLRYRYWEPKVLLLDQARDNSFNQDVLPPQYKESFFQLVSESEDYDFFISEKTAVPLLFNKPFLVVSCANYHANLQALGFKLFDELFDYSFDSISDIEKRYDTLAQEVRRVSLLPNKRDITELLKPKLIHNRKLALAYAFDNYPNGIREVMSLLESENHELATGSLNRLRNLYQNRIL